MNLRKLAKGQECQARIPGICNHNPETTVLAHLNGAGLGIKFPDLIGAWACSNCHAWLDGAYSAYTRKLEDLHSAREHRDLYHLQAIVRTQQQLLKMGLQEVIDKWRE